MSVQKYRLIWHGLIALVTPLLMTSSLLAMWAMTPTENYIHPELWVYDQATGQVTFSRDVREGPPVEARWTHEITLIDGTECSASGTSFYERNDDGLVRFPIPEALRPCADSPLAKRERMQWSVYLWGVIPLRPVTLVQFGGV